MMSEQPIVYTLQKRPFATSPAAIQAIIVNEQEQILMLNNPARGGLWQVISGGLEAGETILAGTLREVAEEAGGAIRVRPLGVVHAQTFHFDSQVRYMISLYYLLAYEGGEVIPGDDMAGSEYRWWSLAELKEEGLVLHGSATPWILERAVSLYHLWRDDVVELQVNLDESK